MIENVAITGKFIAVIFCDENSRFTVAKFKQYDVEEKNITVTGNFPEIYQNILYKLSGVYKSHPKYGHQFCVSSIAKVLPSDYDSVINFLTSPIFPGIGSKIAFKIVDQLGDKCIELIKEDHMILDKVTGISKKQKDSLIAGLLENNDLEEAIAFFTTHGLGIRNIMKLDKAYGKDILKLVKENPYRVVFDIDGIGFNTADEIALSMDFPPHSLERTYSALYTLVLEMSMQNGDTYVNKGTLEIPLTKKLGHHDFDFESIIGYLISAKRIYIEQDRVYHYTQYIAEIDIASYFSRFYNFQSHDFDETQLLDILHHIEEQENIKYEEKQINAVISFMRHSFTILTGGPGTGKTTILKAVIQVYKYLFPYNSIAVCAPTGRAAKRLSELTGIEATTIHRLLKWNLEANSFAVNNEDPLKIDLLVIDEFSMVDNWLLHQIVLASKNIKKIIFVGDENQLPPVACGAALRDLIASEMFNVLRLEKIYRQAENNDVIKVSHAINTNRKINFDGMKDVRFYECDRYSVVNNVLKFVEMALEKGFTLNEIQVLAPKYNGSAGIDNLNRELQKLCNPRNYIKKEIAIGGKIFREGDKILQLKNQPDDNVYNGDIGIIEEVVLASEDFDKKNRIIINFDDNMVEYTSDTFININHAYAISVHKSQGSEYQIVIMPIISEYIYMLTKRLLYTGITRAKKSLILLGNLELFTKVISSNNDYIRKTTLMERLIANKGE